jgi:hypothetical protein
METVRLGDGTRFTLAMAAGGCLAGAGQSSPGRRAAAGSVGEWEIHELAGRRAKLDGRILDKRVLLVTHSAHISSHSLGEAPRSSKIPSSMHNVQCYSRAAISFFRAMKARLWDCSWWDVRVR